MKRRILFVDDEENLLDGLKRGLRPMRHEWDMNFARNGSEALALLSKFPFDVVVSDVRMPGMNGVELLTCVQQQYPHLVRFLLSGSSDEELSLQATGPTHQFLSKPCELELLKEVISRTFALQDRLSDKTLQSLVSQIEALPSPPSIYAELTRQLQNPESSIETIGQIVGRDPSMTAKILKIVNSAFFGLRRTMANPVDAVSYLGIDTIKMLILGIQIFQEVEPESVGMGKGFSVDQLWTHSLSTAALAKKITQIESPCQALADESFAAGLLHDVGILLFVSQFRQKFENCLELIQEGGVSLMEAEQYSFGTTHEVIGAYLLGIWGLGNTVVEAIAYHHTPDNSLVKGFCPLVAVHVANVLVHENEASPDPKPDCDIDHTFLERIGLQSRLDDWRRVCLKVHEHEPA